MSGNNHEISEKTLELRLSRVPSSPSVRQRAHWLRLLDDAERERFCRLPPDRAVAFLVGRALLREVMAAGDRDLPSTVGRSAQGRPLVAGSTDRFSLSYSLQWVAAVRAPGTDVGVDVEVTAGLRRDPLKLARRACTAEEFQWLAGLPAASRPAAFLNLWSLKEAACKACDRALSESLPEPGFSIHEGRIGAPYETGMTCYLGWLPAGGSLALCLAAQRRALSVPVYCGLPFEPSAVSQVLVPLS